MGRFVVLRLVDAAGFEPDAVVFREAAVRDLVRC
ncbi:hypothetical protein Rifp1Sym_bg00100 [endosymbiont of Riftia pachyptila (vent Ph05)]|uniref:Uncharacterized protein n=1 Tax=endosymbiont of Riftia pachyptila (vent Ph05) TaxID=1048808 RepID=G2DCY7_9GAMM|nr:hypothetical protein Rifp1Sym_bg00100 [endosymbiont of Riftia pachyptila (vent Ph05)]